MLAALVLTVLTIVLGVQTWGKAMRVNGNDLTGYLLASRALWHGSNPYTIDSPFPFIYPMFLCVLLWPLTLIPYGAAVLVWFVIAVASFALTMGVMGSLQGSRTGSLVLSVTLVCVLLADIVQNNLLNGQVNFLVLACCAVFAWCWQSGRQGWASASLGAAIALKITPAILLLWLARRRQWRSLAETAAFSILFAVVLPWMVAGSRIMDDYHYYARTFLAGRLTGETTDTAAVPFNLAVSLRRFFAGSSPLDTVATAGLLAVILLLVDRGGRDGRQVALALCLYLAASLLISPMSEVHHLSYLLPGLVLLTARAFDGLASPVACAGTALILLALMSMRFVPGAGFGAVVGTCVLLSASMR
jgi:alpha-1,2-mannosyltransferase